MNFISTKVKIIPSGNDVLYVPKKVINEFHLASNQTIRLFFGMHDTTVKLIEKKIQPNQILLSSSTQRKLLLPYSKQIILKKETNGLRIGPIIGILTTDYYGRKFSNSSTGAQEHFNHFFKTMLEPEATYPAYYFAFTPEHVNWQNRTVDGMFYLTSENKKRWQQMKVPLPDVVYNRVPNRKSENNRMVHHFKEMYQQQGGKLFNSGFFNKWSMHKLLSSDPKIKKFFPETYINPQVNTLEYMLKKHPLVYLKPSGGSLGLGIYKIKKASGQYSLSYRVKNTNHLHQYKSLASLHRAIFKNQFKTENYLIQQGIHLSEYQDRPVDFRVHLHKNRKNEWKVVAIGAKAAGKGSVTTHIRTGGKLLDAYQFIQLTFGSSSRTIIDRLNQAAIEIAKVTEEKLGTPVGELGLDMGIDKEAKIWLFEVNSKPGRSIFKHPGLKAASKLSSQYLLEYGIYLSGF